MKYKVGDLVRSEEYVIYEVIDDSSGYECKRVYGSILVETKTNFSENELYDIPEKKKKELLDYIDRDKQIKIRKYLLNAN